MKKHLKWIIPIIIVAILVIIVLIPKPSSEEQGPLGSYGGIPESMTAVASASTGETIYDGYVFLERIIVGEDEAGATISIIDGVTPSSASAFLDIRGGTLQGVYEIGARLHEGILYTASVSGLTTFIYIPM